MDCICLQVTLDRLLGETMAELKQIKPDILIEFRQRYIGPFIRRYGNMLRVCDCPESELANRVGSIDLWLIEQIYCGDTLTQSSGNERETPETAALQIIDTLFSTMQFSVKMEYLTAEHRNMVENYMDLMRRYRRWLQAGPIKAKSGRISTAGQCQRQRYGDYSSILSGKSRYYRKTAERNHHYQWYKGNRNLYQSRKRNPAKVIQKDCYGEIVEEKDVILAGITELPCTAAGRLEIIKQM